MEGTWRDILTDLRQSAFAELAVSLEKYIGTGKAIRVREIKGRRKGDGLAFERVKLLNDEPGDSAGRGAQQVDIEVVPYTDEECEAIVVEALTQQFVVPGSLVEPILTVLEGIDDVFYSGPVDGEGTSIRRVANVLAGEEFVALADALAHFGKGSK